LIVYTDSIYLVKSQTEWLLKWLHTEWLDRVLQVGSPIQGSTFWATRLWGLVIALSNAIIHQSNSYW
jgi:ribonuclease HI